MQCEGWYRTGGAFSFGPVKWEQCKNEAVLMITTKQNGEVSTLPSCIKCWKTAILFHVEILDVKTIEGNNDESETPKPQRTC